MQHSAEFLALVAEVMPRVREITAAQLAAGGGDRPLVEPLLIDVREDREWQAGHVANAVHMGRGVLERDIVQAVPDKDRALVLYCGGGFRSALAADNLQKMGYRNVYSLAGGYKALAAAGAPIQTS